MASSPLGLDEYQHATTLTDKNDRPGLSGLGFVLFGLFGETGSLLSQLKKKQRDKESYVAYQDSVIEELGDVLWYFANAALRAGLPFSEIATRLPAGLSDWDYRGQEAASTFIDIQTRKDNCDAPHSTEVVERRLMALAANVGQVIDNFRNGRFDTNQAALLADLSDILLALVATADAADVSLDAAARSNMNKTQSRWPREQKWQALYDDDFDEDERLPRRIEIVFKEKDVLGKKYVIQKCNGIAIGDPLTDNHSTPDNYRFHDVFHLAYAAILGWSPVVRRLFKAKRKSRPKIDENEDGARASLIEEGISTWIFNHGLQNHHFRNINALDYSLLKAIQKLVKGYEVESRPLWQWEVAILEGFRVFREVCKHRGGTVIADLEERTITFK